MSQPYDGGECPACGSVNTGSYRNSTALMHGFGARCYDCQAVWHFPGHSDDDPVCPSFADIIHSGVQPVLTAKNTVNSCLTAKSTRPVVENDSYAAFARRVLRAYARRVATGDIAALTRMAELAQDIDTAIRHAITGLRTCGYSWAEIGRQLGITRQAAQQRWGPGAVASNRTTSRKDT